MKYLVSYKIGDKERESVFFWKETFLGKSILFSLSLSLSLTVLVFLLFFQVYCLWCVFIISILCLPVSYSIIFLYILYVNSPFYFSYAACHDRPVTFYFHGALGDLTIEDGYRSVRWRDGKYSVYKYGTGTMVVNGLVVHYIPSSSELHEYIRQHGQL